MYIKFFFFSFFIAISPSITYTMEDAVKLTVVNGFKEAQQFAGRIVLYKPRQTLGERFNDPNSKLNFGYIDSVCDFFPDASPEDAFLKLYTLKYHQDDALTRVISAKTLAQEALKLRLAKRKDIQELDKLFAVRHEFTFSSSQTDRESYCTFACLRDVEVQKAIALID